MTIEEVRGYINGVLETIDGDIPRKLFKKIAKMMDEVETTVYATGNQTTIIERPYYSRRYWWWYQDRVTWCDGNSNIPSDISITYSSAEAAWEAKGVSDAKSYTNS